MRPLLPLCAGALMLACTGAAGARDRPASDSVVAAPRAPAAVARDSTLAGLQATWTPLRAALLADDTAAVAALTRFPLTVRGSLDSDPVQRIGEAELAPVLHRLLEVNVGTLAAPETTRAWLERTPSVDASALAPDGQEARVGPFALAFTDGGWRLVLLYLEE